MQTIFQRVQELQKKPRHKKPMDRLITELHQDVPTSIIQGRNVIAGHLRAWGNHYDILSSFVTKDPIFRESIDYVGKRSLMGTSNFINLFLILKYGIKDRSGDIIEFGVYKGGSAIFIANTARRLGFTGNVYALDTFQGTPRSRLQLDFHQSGDFDDTSLEELMEYRNQIGLTNLIPIKGLFKKTAPTLLKKSQNIVLAHVDCDLYESVRDAISMVKPHMHPQGGYLIFDDTWHGTCLGALQAAEEMVQRDHLRAASCHGRRTCRVGSVRPVRRSSANGSMAATKPQSGLDSNSPAAERQEGRSQRASLPSGHGTFGSTAAAAD